MHYCVVQLAGLRLFWGCGDCQKQRAPQHRSDDGSAQHTCYMRAYLHCGARYTTNKCNQALAQVSATWLGWERDRKQWANTVTVHPPT
jgi:hypothetical protein